MNMATQVQFRRGTTAEHATFTGAVGEVTVDTTLDTLRVHDGAVAGGYRIAKFSEVPATLNFTVDADDSASIIIPTNGTGSLRFTGGNSLTSSTDSAGTVSFSLDKSIDINTISSSDSTSVTISDGLIVTGNLSFDGGVSVSTILDEDNFASDSATALATQQSIKAYVDSATTSGAIALGTDTSGNYVASITNGSFITGGDGGSEGAGLTLSVDATDANTASKVVARDASGNFSAGTITANLTGNVTGNADTATTATNVTATANNTTNETVYLTFVDGATGTQGIETDTNLSYNPSTNILSTTASQAQYADLAERYSADAIYDEGHVVVHGGAKEITESNQENDTRIAGVISERWAYLMNQQEDGPAVALKGKVQCKVVGSVSKGDLLVSSSTPGHAVASESPNPMAIIGRSMVDDENTHPRKIFIKI